MINERFLLSSYKRNLNDMYSVLYFDQDNIFPHSHEFFEFVYVLDGTAIHTLDGVSSIVKAGSYFIIDIGSIHSYESRNNFKIINILFAPEFLDEALHNTNDSKNLIRKTMLQFCHIDISESCSFQSFTDEDNKMRKLFEEILEEYQMKLPGYDQAVRLLLLRAFILIIRQYLQKQPNNKSVLIQYPKTIKEAIAFINQNYASSHLLSDFCKKYHYSSEYISRLFKNQTGITFTAFTQKTRIEAALTLLKQTNMPVSEIANQVGYEDIKTFQKTFKNLTGLTPSECRKS